jgi:hypothetical protein
VVQFSDFCCLQTLGVFIFKNLIHATESFSIFVRLRSFFLSKILTTTLPCDAANFQKHITEREKSPFVL